MPWQEASAASEQQRFIGAWLRGEETVAALCRRFGISRKTGYKRINRFKPGGLAGLGDRSRAPHTHPNATPVAVAQQVIALKRAHPTWGPKKVIATLATAQPTVSWPAPSTAGAILQRAGLVTPRRHRRRTAAWQAPFTAATVANDVWCMDFKGWFRTTDGTRIDPLTVQDAASRYLLACRGLTQPRGSEVRRVLERVLREYGLPRAIRTDNGPPFASLALGGLSALAVWWIKLGIRPERIAPGHPEQNGRLERLHRTLKAETTTPPQASPSRQQRVFDTFRHGYNDQRPHEALGQRPPARVYRPSDRAYPRRLRPPEYGRDVTVRKVRTNGQIRWHGALIYLSETLRGEPVGLVPQDDRYWTIQYGPVQLGRLDAQTGQVLPTPTTVLPMSPV